MHTHTQHTIFIHILSAICISFHVSRILCEPAVCICANECEPKPNCLHSNLLPLSLLVPRAIVPSECAAVVVVVGFILWCRRTRRHRLRAHVYCVYAPVRSGHVRICMAFSMGSHCPGPLYNIMLEQRQQRQQQSAAMVSRPPFTGIVCLRVAVCVEI